MNNENISNHIPLFLTENKSNHITWTTQSRKRRKTGACPAPAPAAACLVQKGCPAWTHSLSIRACTPAQISLHTGLSYCESDQGKLALEKL